MKQNSFRRKDRQVIAESKSQRDAQKASQTQEEILGGIHDRLGDVQASSELTTDAVENTGSNILDGIDSLSNTISQNLGDVQAATELTAEAVEKGTGEFRKLNDIASQISDKLSQLTTALENKLSAQTPSSGPSSNATSSSSTALAVISDAIPDIQTDQEKITEALDDLLPRLDNNKNDADFLDSPVPVVVPQEQKKNEVTPRESEDDKKDKKGLLSKIGDLLKVTKEGFKSSIGFSDKIAGMLFKYTVTAAIEAAKTAAMLLSLVLAIDVIRINFNYWAELLKTNFVEFSERLGKWGPLLEDIIKAVNDVKSAWEKGDWSGLTIAIIKGVGKAIYNLSELLIVGISKLMASVIRLIPGQGDRADAMEADALKTYQKHTGGKLTDEESTLVAKQDVKQMNENKESSPGIVSDMADKFRLKNGQITEDEYNQRKAQRENGGKDPFFKLSEEEQIKVIKARNEAQASIDRTGDYIDDGDKTSDSFKKSAQGAISDIQKNIDSGDLDKTPEIKAELQGKIDDLNKKYNSLVAGKSNVSASSPKDSEEVKSVEKINAQSNTQASTSPQGGNYTQVNNNVRKSTNQFSLPTQTATVAPGMFGHAGKVN